MTKKTRKATVATKFYKKTYLGAPFVAKKRFLMIFEAPGEPQKLLKIYDPFPVKGSWESSGSHFV